MSKEEIFKSLDGMLENQKSKNFLNHLIHSYMPTNKIVKVFETPKGDFKCALTRENLCSISEVLDIPSQDGFMDIFINSLKIGDDGKTNTINPYIEFLGDKKLGFTGKDTTTFLSNEALESFIDWVLTKILNGDKHINWLMNKINRFDDNQYKSNKPKLKKTIVDTSAKFNLGDSNDALAKLKSKMESDEN
jgi:hypothetical protein